MVAILRGNTDALQCCQAYQALPGMTGELYIEKSACSSLFVWTFLQSIFLREHDQSMLYHIPPKIIIKVYLTVNTATSISERCNITSIDLGFSLESLSPGTSSFLQHQPRGQFDTPSEEYCGSRSMTSFGGLGAQRNHLTI